MNFCCFQIQFFLKIKGLLGQIILCDTMVILNLLKNTCNPMGNCIKIMINTNQYKSISRLNWTAEQEELLKILRETNGIKSWTTISIQLNKVIEGKNRSGKQCRERYMNYVRFSNSNNNLSKWTIEQEKQLFQYFLIDGRKWVQICKKLNGKSENCLKNRFYGAIRKISRRINKTFKEQKIKQKKILKQETFIKILETKENSTLNHANSYSNQSLASLKNDIVRLAIMPEQDLLPEQIISFTNRVYDYLSQARPCVETKKVPKQFELPSVEKILDEIQQNDGSFNISPPKQTGGWPQLFEEEEDSKLKQQRTYLFELGLDLVKYNSSVTYDLDKQVGEILNEDFIVQNLQIL